MKLLWINFLLVLFWVPICYGLYNDRRKAGKLYLWITGIQLFFFHAFKSWQNSMPDLPMYGVLFNQFHRGLPLVNKERYEFGYGMLNWIVANLGGDLLSLSIVISAIIIGGYILLIWRYSKIPWLSVILLICLPYLQSLFVLRQHIAVVICLFASKYIISRRLIPFILITFIAAQFHKSAYIFLPSYFIYGVTINSTFWLRFILVSIGSAFIMTGAMLAVSQSLETYDFYFETSKDEGTTMTPALISGVILLLTRITVKIEALNGMTRLAFMMTCAAFILNFGGIGVPLIPRLAWYYTTYSIFLIPNVIAIQKKDLRLVLTPTIVICFTLLFYSTLVNGGYFDKYHLIF